MKSCLIKNFFMCGAAGWCWECFFSGLNSILHKKDKELVCKTSLWMFPIYGAAALMLPICKCVKKRCLFVRGMIYTVCIFIAEYATGCLLKRFKACPWDYSKAKLNYKGVIRLDYAPAWFLLGIIFEKLLKHDILMEKDK